LRETTKARKKGAELAAADNGCEAFFFAGFFLNDKHGSGRVGHQAGGAAFEMEFT